MGYEEAGTNARTMDWSVDTKPMGGIWDQPGEPTLSIVEAVGAARDCAPTDLPPLHDYVDTDALESILAGASERAQAVRLSFEYDGCEVVVETEATTNVWVRLADSD